MATNCFHKSTSSTPVRPADFQPCAQRLSTRESSAPKNGLELAKLTLALESLH